MTDTRPLASVSLDADNLWSYIKTHGDPGWEQRPTFLPRFVPQALDLLEELRLRITFFLVGLDADRDENAEALGSITRRGHDVGNHSYEHEPWLHRYSRGALEAEIERTDDAIERVTGSRPVGFRGPGYSWSPALLKVLAERGYVFDSSTLPTWLGPAARAYYFATAKLSPEARRERKILFGTLADGLRPVGPYYWQLGERQLLEIPVTTMPVLKAPFYLSYLLYLSRFSERIAEAWLRTSLAACRAAGIGPSFLLHPLDLLGPDQVSELAFFPGMDLSTARKHRLFLRFMRILGEKYRLVPMLEHATAIRARGSLALRVPAGRPDGVD